MRVYDIKLDIFQSVDIKEEMTETMYIVTEAEVEGIRDQLNNKGYVWVENNEVKFSGPKPTEYHDWDETNKEWVYNDQEYVNYLTRCRQEVWEKIKEIRAQHQASGVYIKSVDKWFHTDAEQYRNYQASKDMVDIKKFQEIPWKTMDGQLVQMTKELLFEVIAACYNKAQQDFFNAEKHKAMLQVSENPYDYDYSTGWSDRYSGPQEIS